jgi:hypothetical protein
MAFGKTQCAVTRSEFRQHAQDLPMQLGDLKDLSAGVKEFSTGSLGWNLSEKRDLQLNGHTVKVQIGLNVTIIGSKELPNDSAS